MRAGRLFIIGIMMHLALAAGAAAAPAAVRETLNYQVSLGPWDDVARVQLVFTEVAPGRYLAEFSGAAQGMWKLLSRWLPERYQTEMVYRDGRLVPEVFREEFLSKGQHVKKEYRFDQEHNRLALWRQADGQDPVKKWEIPLKGPVYDLLSLFYNVRLGAFGPLPGGSALKVAVLPTPEPQELVFRIGPATDQGRKVMVNHRPPEASEANQYYIYLNSQQVPTQAWTRVTIFGKLSGCLLNAGEISQEGLLALPPCPAPDLKPHP
jgi:hypothetical protein